MSQVAHLALELQAEKEEAKWRQTKFRAGDTAYSTLKVPLTPQFFFPNINFIFLLITTAKKISL